MLAGSLSLVGRDRPRKGDCPGEARRLFLFELINSGFFSLVQDFTADRFAFASRSRQAPKGGLSRRGLVSVPFRAN